MIEVENLTKRFGELVAVDGVSLTARAGAITGLLGPNGAGKSTTIGCICGLVDPSEGRVRVLGHDVREDGRAARQSLGVVPQELALYEDLNARENLAYWGATYGLAGAHLKARVEAVLAEIGLADRGKEAVSKFSGGMKRRLNFGCALVHEPQVLLLDEPTVGVDPQSRVKLLDLVRAKARAGACVLYTTHYMEEAEALCDWLEVIDHGRVVASGTLSELRARVGERDLLQLKGVFEPEAVRRALAPLGELELGEIETVKLEPELVVLALRDASRRLSALFQALDAAGAQVRETTLKQPSLESLFITLTGKELRE